MVSEQSVSKIRTMLDMKLTLGQVMAGSFVTITTVVSIMLYVQNTYETKADAVVKTNQFESRMLKMENGFDSQAKMQTEIYGDVKKISGILESQMAEKNARVGK